MNNVQLTLNKNLFIHYWPMLKTIRKYPNENELRGETEMIFKKTEIKKNIYILSNRAERTDEESFF